MPSPVRIRGRPLLALLAALALAVLCVLGLSACANTVQDQPVAPSFLEPLIVQDEYPVYWLGGSFRRLPIISVGRDPGGAYEIQYGNCTEGGENVCVTPLQIVTSPDNSFHPGGSAPTRTVSLRGVPSLLAQGGNTIVVPTGPVIVDIYANRPALALAAAETMVPINAVQLAGAPLPRALPDTGFAQKPLPYQQPPVVPSAHRVPSLG